MCMDGVPADALCCTPAGLFIIFALISWDNLPMSYLRMMLSHVLNLFTIIITMVTTIIIVDLILAIAM